MSTLIVPYPSPKVMTPDDQWIAIRDRIAELKDNSALLRGKPLAEYLKAKRVHNPHAVSEMFGDGLAETDLVCLITPRGFNDYLRSMPEAKINYEREILLRTTGDLVLVEHISKIKGYVIEFPHAVSVSIPNEEILRDLIIKRGLTFSLLSLIDDCISGLIAECRRHEEHLQELFYRGHFRGEACAQKEGYPTLAAMQDALEAPAREDFYRRLKST